MKTSDNPGSFSPYHFRSVRTIGGSFLRKLKAKEFVGAFNLLMVEALNKLNKNKLINKQGKYFCPLCENRSGAFIHLANNIRFRYNSCCPYCSSRARHRGLFYLYKKTVAGLNAESKVLHFAPEPIFYPIFRHKSFIYQTTDYILTDVDLPKQDVQQLTIADDVYDLVLSNHVIEHVPDDEKALSEMYRITKKGGKVIISVPGNYKRLGTVYFKHLNNNGHYRDYGVDFVEKMKKLFPTVEVIDLHNFDTSGELAIPEKELVFVGIK